jgi:hypothetical protein
MMFRLSSSRSRAEPPDDAPAHSARPLDENLPSTSLRAITHEIAGTPPVSTRSWDASHTPRPSSHSGRLDGKVRTPRAGAPTKGAARGTSEGMNRTRPGS